MKDWVEGNVDRNYWIRRTAGAKEWKEAVAIVLLLAMVSGALFAHLWIHGQILAVERQIQKTRSEMDAQRRVQGWLMAEEQVLKSPERIDAIARIRLRMSPLQARQILPAHWLDSSLVLSPQMAMAGVPGSLTAK